MSRRDQNVVLDDFWWHASQDTRRDVRLGLLQKCAAVRVRTSFGIQPKRMRASWLRQRTRGHIFSQAFCFVCLTRNRPDRFVQHHIIQIQHGGTNARRNNVTVCRPCHAEIHPWLKTAVTRTTDKPSERVARLVTPGGLRVGGTAAHVGAGAGRHEPVNDIATNPTTEPIRQIVRRF